MRFVAAVVAAVTVSLPGAAAAQPGRTPAQPEPGAGWGTPPGWGTPQPQQSPPGYHLLTAEERQLLLEGEISDERHVIGAAVSLMVGWGLGQAVQGRFDDTGWIFLVGETASLAGLVTGAVSCANRGDACREAEVGLIVAGAVAFCVLRVWEVVDAAVGPASHNREVRRIRAKAFGEPSAPPWSFHLLPTSTEGSLTGATAGLSLRF